MPNLRARKLFSSVALVAVAGLTFSACSTENASDEPANTSNSSSSSNTNESKQEAPTPVASIDALTGKTTEVALDEGFTTALADLGLTAGVVGDAKLAAGKGPQGSLVFPISGGNVTVFEPGEVSPYVIGQVQHENSGFSLTAGDTTVEIRNLNVDPGVSRVYGDVFVNGKLAAPSAYVLKLDGRTLNPLEANDTTATLQGTEVYVSPVAAGLLNDTFGTDAVTEDLLVGVAKITVNVKSGD